MPILYTSDIFGGNVTISVATFVNLPATGEENQRVLITGESSLFDSNYPAIVCWNTATSVWQVEQATATYLNIAAVEFNSGIWVGTGAALGTKPNAIIRDTTYNESWTWNSTSNLFTPTYLGLSTVQNQKRIKGDSTTLESGWTSTTGTGCTLTTDGSKLTMYAQSGAGVTYSSVVTFDDTSRTLTSNFYMKCLIARANDSNWTQATTGQIAMYLQYLSGPSTGKAVEFGDADIASGSPTSFTGNFINRAGTFATYTATANRGDVLTSETLLQFRVIAGATAQVKVGTGGWHDIAVSTCRSGAGTSFTIGTSSNNSTTNKAQCTLRYLQAIRFT